MLSFERIDFVLTADVIWFIDNSHTSSNYKMRGSHVRWYTDNSYNGIDYKRRGSHVGWFTGNSYNRSDYKTRGSHVSWFTDNSDNSRDYKMRGSHVSWCTGNSDNSIDYKMNRSHASWFTDNSDNSTDYKMTGSHEDDKIAYKWFTFVLEFALKGVTQDVRIKCIPESEAGPREIKSRDWTDMRRQKIVRDDRYFFVDDALGIRPTATGFVDNRFIW